MKDKDPRNAKPVLPVPVCQIRISVMPNGETNVSGFPNSFDEAMAVMQTGLKAIAAHFLREAIAGRVDDRGHLVKSPIVIPKPKVSLAGTN